MQRMTNPAGFAFPRRRLRTALIAVFAAFALTISLGASGATAQQLPPQPPSVLGSWLSFHHRTPLEHLDVKPEPLCVITCQPGVWVSGHWQDGRPIGQRFARLVNAQYAIYEARLTYTVIRLNHPPQTIPVRLRFRPYAQWLNVTSWYGRHPRYIEYFGRGTYVPPPPPR